LPKWKDVYAKLNMKSYKLFMGDSDGPD